MNDLLVSPLSHDSRRRLHGANGRGAGPRGGRESPLEAGRGGLLRALFGKPGPSQGGDEERQNARDPDGYRLQKVRPEDGHPLGKNGSSSPARPIRTARTRGSSRGTRRGSSRRRRPRQARPARTAGAPWSTSGGDSDRSSPARATPSARRHGRLERDRREPAAPRNRRVRRAGSAGVPSSSARGASAASSPACATRPARPPSRSASASLALSRTAADTSRPKNEAGRTFYSCSRYPDCKYAVWDRPVPTPCPACGAPFLVENRTKKNGTVLKCVREGCDHPAGLRFPASGAS